MRRAVVLAAVGAVLAVAAVPSAPAAYRPLPKLATGGVPGYAPLYVVRPHTIWFTGDSTGIIGADRQ